jgi:hypothetical protein
VTLSTLLENAAFMISGAWLLLVGVHQDQQRLPAAPTES